MTSGSLIDFDNQLNSIVCFWGSIIDVYIRFPCFIERCSCCLYEIKQHFSYYHFINIVINVKKETILAFIREIIPITLCWVK